MKPKERTQSGYRLYTNRDFGRLEQIVVLKFLGMPLKQIRRLIEHESKLGEALQRQQTVLAEKRQQIDLAIAAIRNAQSSFEAKNEPDWKLFRYVIQEIEMQNSMDWSKKYYGAEAQAKIEARKHLWSPELQERATHEWTKLVAEVEAALGEDPAGPKAQALAARWRKLVEGFTGGDPEILNGLRAMWQDKPNWPESARKAFGDKPTIRPEVHAFIRKAMHAGK